MKQSRYLVAYYSVLIGVGLIAGCLGPVLPALARQTQSSLQQVSIILAMRPAGYLAGTLISGRVMDRMPAHPALSLALMLAAAALIFTPHIPALAPLTALILLLGFADGFLDVGANTLLPWVYGEKVGPYLNGMHFAFGLGALSAPLIVARAVSASAGISPAFWVMGLALLPVSAGLLLLPSPGHGDADAAQDARPLDRRAAAWIVAIFVAYGGAEAAYGGWIYSYAVKSGLADAQGGAYLTSLFWGSLTAGRGLGIYLALRIPAPKILAFDALGSVLCLGAIVAFPHSSRVLWAGSILGGLCMASFFPTLLAYASRRLGNSHGRISGGLTSLFFVGSSTGAMLLPWLIGQGFDRLGPITAPALILASLMAMGLGLFPLLRAS